MNTANGISIALHGGVRLVMVQQVVMVFLSSGSGVTCCIGMCTVLLLHCKGQK